MATGACRGFWSTCGCRIVLRTRRSVRGYVPGVARGGCDEAGGSFVRARDLSHPVGAADLCRVCGHGGGAGAGVAGGADDIAKVTRHDLMGRVTDVRQPLSTGSDAGTTLTAHYTVAAQPATNATCGGKPECAGLVCRTYPAAGQARTWGLAGHIPSETRCSDVD